MSTPNQSQAVFPRFFLKTVDDPVATATEGRPMFKDVEYIEIRIAGDKTTVVTKKVTDEHKQRWPTQYEQFKKNITQTLDGTPLSEWSALPGSKVRELQGMNIHTIEALAEVSDGNIHSLGMGARELRNKAKLFIENSKDNAGFEKLLSENTKLADKIQLLESQLSEVLKRVPANAA